MPGTLWVPASATSGRKSGISGSWERLPVPPSKRGFGVRPHSRSPVPWGPWSPLCPGMAMKAASHAWRDTGSAPADWEASTISGTPRVRQMAAMPATGRI